MRFEESSDDFTIGPPSAWFLIPRSVKSQETGRVFKVSVHQGFPNAILKSHTEGVVYLFRERPRTVHDPTEGHYDSHGVKASQSLSLKNCPKRNPFN